MDDPGTPRHPLSRTERFEKFHDTNPHIADLLVALARQWRATGRTRLGVRSLWERMRWDLAVRTTSDDEVKLNDQHTSFYVRMIISDYPELADMFEIRSAPEADAWAAIRRLRRDEPS